MSSGNWLEEIDWIKEKSKCNWCSRFKNYFYKAPFLLDEQFLWDKKFRQYLQTIMVFKKALRMGVQKTSIQKTWNFYCILQHKHRFLGSNRQFDWLEISLVYDKSKKHTTIHNSYYVELAAKYIKSVKLKSFIDIYSLINEKNIQLIIQHKNIFYTSSLLPVSATDRLYS